MLLQGNKRHITDFDEYKLLSPIDVSIQLENTRKVRYFYRTISSIMPSGGHLWCVSAVKVLGLQCRIVGGVTYVRRGNTLLVKAHVNLKGNYGKSKIKVNK